MAPPLRPFPVSDLEQRIHTHSVNLYDKNRKLPQDFDLKRDCDLFELVQYSCTTQQQHLENIARGTGNSGSGGGAGRGAQLECFPFVRLFRRCKHRDKVFHVETTAWEGQHAWRPETSPDQIQISTKDNTNAIAEYGNHFLPNR